MHEKSFERLFKPQDPEALRLWQMGIMLLHPENVAEAIARGIDVNTPIGSTNVIGSLLGLHRPLYTDDMTPDKMAKRTAIATIVRMILNEGPDLAQKDSWEMSDLDRAMTRSHDHELAADVIISGLLHQAQAGHDLYEPDMHVIFTQPEIRQVLADKRASMYTTMQRVHHAVLTKLAEPSNLVEQTLVQDHADKLSYWMTPLDMPALEDLPEPSEEAIDSIELFFASSKHIEGTRKNTPNDASALEIENDEMRRHLANARRASAFTPKKP